MAGKTKDERFVLAAYESARAAGDVFSPVDRYEMGKKIGINTKTVDTICRLLAQANFIKFLGVTEIHLTENGKALAESLI